MNNTYLTEAFQKLDLLESEDFDLSDFDVVDDIKDFKDNDEEDTTIEIIDDEAESEEELQDSYIGKIIIECNVCHSLIYKNREDLEFNEDKSCVNMDEECPVCFSNEGFSIIGQVEPFEEVTVEITDKDEDDIADDEEEDKEDVDESLLNERTNAKDVLNNVVSTVGDVAKTAVNQVGSNLQTAQNNAATVRQNRMNNTANTVQNALNNTAKVATNAMDNNASKGVARSNAIASAVNGANTGDNLMKGAKALRGVHEGCECCDDELDETVGGTLAGAAIGALAGKSQGHKIGSGLLKDVVRGASVGSGLSNMVADKGNDRINGAKIGYGATGKLGGAVAGAVVGKKADDIVDDIANKVGLKKNENNESLNEMARPQGSKKHQWQIGDRVILKKSKNIENDSMLSTKDKNEWGKHINKEATVNDLDWEYANNKNQLLSIKFDDGYEMHVYPRDVKLISDESLKEDLNNIELDTENQHIEIKSSPKEDNPDAEMISPIAPEEFAPKEDEMEEPPMEMPQDMEEEPMMDDKEIDADVDQIETESFDRLGESYLRNVYENVKSFKTTSASSKGNQLFIEGLIKFNSGSTKKTSFIFESRTIDTNHKARFVGENAQITRGKKAFTLSGSLNNGRFISESLNYNYRQKNTDGKSTRVYGTVKVNEGIKKQPAKRK